MDVLAVGRINVLMNMCVCLLLKIYVCHFQVMGFSVYLSSFGIHVNYIIISLVFTQYCVYSCQEYTFFSKCPHFQNTTPPPHQSTTHYIDFVIIVQSYIFGPTFLSAIELCRFGQLWLNGHACPACACVRFYLSP